MIDRLGDGDVSGVVPLVGRHPGPGLLAAEDAELEGAAPGDAAEDAGRELLVVLELQPVDQAVLVPEGMHRFEQFLAVEFAATSGPNRVRKVR